jgi:RimJ/RimL family protein N-acetyltransferase
MTATGVIPVLETERLRLRRARPADLACHAAMLADPEVMRFVGGQPHAREEAWRRLLTSTGLWTLLGYGYWTLERREDGAYLGQIGFGDFKRDLDPSIEGLPEMGWLLQREAHGQGYASEAVAAGLQWADRALAGQTFTAIIHRENAASIRVAEKAGFGEAVETSYKGEPTLIFYRRPVG